MGRWGKVGKTQGTASCPLWQEQQKSRKRAVEKNLMRQMAELSSTRFIVLRDLWASIQALDPVRTSCATTVLSPSPVPVYTHWLIATLQPSISSGSQRSVLLQN